MNSIGSNDNSRKDSDEKDIDTSADLTGDELIAKIKENLDLLNAAEDMDS